MTDTPSPNPFAQIARVEHEPETVSDPITVDEAYGALYGLTREQLDVEARHAVHVAYSVGNQYGRLFDDSGEPYDRDDIYRRRGNAMTDTDVESYSEASLPDIDVSSIRDQLDAARERQTFTLDHDLNEGVALITARNVLAINADGNTRYFTQMRHKSVELLFSTGGAINWAMDLGFFPSGRITFSDNDHSSTPLRRA